MKKCMSQKLKDQCCLTKINYDYVVKESEKVSQSQNKGQIDIDFDLLDGFLIEEISIKDFDQIEFVVSEITIDDFDWGEP